MRRRGTKWAGKEGGIGFAQLRAGEAWLCASSTNVLARGSFPCEPKEVNSREARVLSIAFMFSKETECYEEKRAKNS